MMFLQRPPFSIRASSLRNGLVAVALLGLSASQTFGIITLNIDLGSDEIWFSGSDVGITNDANFLDWSPTGNYTGVAPLETTGLGSPEDFTFSSLSPDTNAPAAFLGGFANGSLELFGFDFKSAGFQLEAVENRYTYSSLFDESQRSMLENLDELLIVDGATFSNIPIVVTPASAVPEPGTWALFLALPVSLFVGFRRHRNRRQS